jgi:hypothetical protein
MDTSDTVAGAGELHLPSFITPPGETDVLYIVIIVLAVAGVFALGTLYFKLHALPEHMAHRASRTQYQLVAILALIALFTHNNLFWIAALLLAAVQIPDFMTPLRSVAASLERMAPPPMDAPPAPPTPPMDEAAQAGAAGAGRSYPPAEDAPERGTL